METHASEIIVHTAMRAKCYKNDKTSRRTTSSSSYRANLQVRREDANGIAAACKGPKWKVPEFDLYHDYEKDAPPAPRRPESECEALIPIPSPNGSRWVLERAGHDLAAETVLLVQAIGSATQRSLDGYDDETQDDRVYLV